MKWVAKGSTFRAERCGKLLGYIQKDKETKLYKWTCSVFASRAESKSCGFHPTLKGAVLAFEDFWKLSLSCYGLVEDSTIKEKRLPLYFRTTEFSDKDVKDLREVL